MWKPKYKDLENKAFIIEEEHKKNIDEGMPKMKSAKKLGRKYKLSMWSIYRYLQYVDHVRKNNNDK